MVEVLIESVELVLDVESDDGDFAARGEFYLLFWGGHHVMGRWGMELIRVEYHSAHGVHKRILFLAEWKEGISV